VGRDSFCHPSSFKQNSHQVFGVGHPHLTHRLKPTVLQASFSFALCLSSFVMGRISFIGLPDLTTTRPTATALPQQAQPDHTGPKLATPRLTVPEPPCRAGPDQTLPRHAKTARPDQTLPRHARPRLNRRAASPCAFA